MKSIKANISDWHAVRAKFPSAWLRFVSWFEAHYPAIYNHADNWTEQIVFGDLTTFFEDNNVAHINGNLTILPMPVNEEYSILKSFEVLEYSISLNPQGESDVFETLAQITKPIEVNKLSDKAKKSLGLI